MALINFLGTLTLRLALDDDRQELIDRKHLQYDLSFRIEDDYNLERRRSMLRHLSPYHYEQQFIAARELALRGR